MKETAFVYRNNVLCAEAMPLAEIAEDVETPFCCLSDSQLKANWEAFVSPFATLASGFSYCVRANPNLSVLRTFIKAGAGLQVCCAGELERAIQAGAMPSALTFCGTGKDRDDLSAALLAGVSCVQVESAAEIESLAALAHLLDARLSVVLRVNVGAASGAREASYAPMGQRKYGFSIEAVPQALAQLYAPESRLTFAGFAAALDPAGPREVCEQALARLAEMVALCRAQGVMAARIDLEMAQKAYAPDVYPALAGLVRRWLYPLGIRVCLSAGIALVADAGILVTRLLQIKESNGRRFFVVDASMDDMARPALFGAPREIIPARESTDAGKLTRVSVVGPVSEPSDQYSDCYWMDVAQVGDLFAVTSFGMGSGMTISGRALMAEILVSGADYALIRRRVAVVEQMEWESFPDWMADEHAA